MNRPSASKQGEDFPTPRTDKLIEKMLEGDGIPVCEEWDRLLAHAKEMERMCQAQTAVAAALLRYGKGCAAQDYIRALKGAPVPESGPSEEGK